MFRYLTTNGFEIQTRPIRTRDTLFTTTFALCSRAPRRPPIHKLGCCAGFHRFFNNSGINTRMSTNATPQLSATELKAMAARLDSAANSWTTVP